MFAILNNKTRRQNPASPCANVTGVILAGGSSSRFGTNKALAVIDGRYLIEHIASRLKELFTSLLLVTSVPETYRFLNLPMTDDRIKGAGPLAGIHAALSEISSRNAFITACDMPLLDVRLIRHLCMIAHSSNSDAVIPYPEGLPEPLYAVYSVTALPAIEALLARGERSITRAVASLSIRRVTADEILQHVPDFSTFTNINQQEDFARFEDKKKGRKVSAPEK